MRNETLEKKKWVEDKEELGILCWEYLGEIRYIFIKKRGFIFPKKKCLFKEVIFYIHCSKFYCKQDHSKKCYSDLKKE